MTEYRDAGSMTWALGTLADLAGGRILGDPATRISGAADVNEARDGDLVFAESARYVQKAIRSAAAAVITTEELASGAGVEKPLLVVVDPRLAFVMTLQAMTPITAAPDGVDPRSNIGAGAALGDEARVGAFVTVGNGATIGARVTLLDGCRIGAGCVIGDDCIVHPNVVLYPGVTIGNRCILHAGCVIGADGFGYIPVGFALRKVPQLGTVVVGDDVEIGANSCIDRAKTGATVIGNGTKIDNLVQIAHNVRIGMSSIIVAQAGIAGSVRIGAGVIVGGQVGIGDHISIGDGARLGSQSGVIGDVAAGDTVSGYPARPHRRKMREYGAVANLPEYVTRLRALEKRVAELTGGAAAAVAPDSANTEV